MYVRCINMIKVFHKRKRAINHWRRGDKFYNKTAYIFCLCVCVLWNLELNKRRRQTQESRDEKNQERHTTHVSNARTHTHTFRCHDFNRAACRYLSRNLDTYISRVRIEMTGMTFWLSHGPPVRLNVVRGCGAAA